MFVSHHFLPVGVLTVTVGEVGGTPAADWLADELFGGHYQRKDDEHGARYLAREAVTEVVVTSRLQQQANTL